MDGIPRNAEDAAEFVKQVTAGLPELIVHSGNLPATALALRDLLARTGGIYDRGWPGKLVQPADGSSPIFVALTVSGVVMEAHRIAQPIKYGADRMAKLVTLADRVAKMYLEMGTWNLRPLAGIATAPLLTSDGAIITNTGYDPLTGFWCAQVPALQVPECPTRQQAESALLTLRRVFRTIPFADSVRLADCQGSIVIDLSRSPGMAESTFLVAVLTAVCRVSLWLAPGLLVIAPALSGAGSGKGLLVRALSHIAFGTAPRAFTAGHDRAELDKRIVAELIEAAPILFLDNLNGTALRSDTLASVLTERPARVRVMGVSKMVPLNCTAFIAITGNGLTVSEDLARRFMICNLDPQMENPEARPFPGGVDRFLADIRDRRAELLTAALTIWRWGRQNEGTLSQGMPLGSYETWCRWVRDPLLALGCADPVERVRNAKANDPRRRAVIELFTTWNAKHGENPITAARLAPEVLTTLNPQQRSRQWMAQRLIELTDTRAAGFVLTREASGEWNAATYALLRAEAVL